MALEIRILGPLELLADGEPVPLGGRMRRSFVAALALRAGETVPADRLLEELWPGEAAGKGRLQVYVSQLRKALGAEAAALESRGGGYALAVGREALDAARFERLAALGRDALAAGEPERAAALLADALALWRGPALADLAYEAVAQAAAARLEELRLSCAEDRLDAELALGRHAEVVAELERLVAEHPLRERPHGQLMLALYRCGRQADALAVYRETRQALSEELGLEPGPELRALQRRILRHDPALTVEPPELRGRRHLPAPQTALVGRRAELDELGALVRDGTTRLLTLTGPGGAGKTRLALQAAHELADAFTDGVWFVDLSRLRDGDLVAAAVAQALGVEEEAERAVSETLQDRLRPRRLLLVLDTFEVVARAAPLLAQLLAAAPGLVILVTSRTPLRLTAEHELRVGPLPHGDAARLFAARARAVAPGFRRPSEEAAEVAELCRRLDHLPLAIELAAARTRSHSARELLGALPLELAGGDAPDLPQRQRTLRATIDWSHDLLAPAEQDAFARLAVFAGGCTRAAARDVCGAGAETLALLVAHSLLRERPGHDGETRYHMLDTIREYADERLERSDAGRDVRRRHAEHFLDLAETADRELAGPRQAARLAQLDDEHDNLRAALAACREAGEAELELRLACSLARYREVRGHLRESRRALESALEAAERAPPPLRARALEALTTLALRQGDGKAMRGFAEEHVALARAVGDEAAVARGLDRLATAASNDGDPTRGAELYRESIALARRLGDRRGLAVSTSNLGCLALMQGDYARAQALCREGLELFRELGEEDAAHKPLFNLGLATFLAGAHDEAGSWLRSGLALARELDYPEAAIYYLEALAAVAVATGAHEHGAVLLGAAARAAEATGVTLEPFEQSVHERTVDALADALGADGLAAALASGRSLELQAAIERAFAASGGTPDAVSAPPRRDGLVGAGPGAA